MEQTTFHKSFQTIGLIGLVVGLGLMFGTGSFTAQSVFYGWVFWTCVTFGFFSLSVLHHMTKGSWGYPIRRLLEAGSHPLMMLVFAIPILLIAFNIGGWLDVLYPEWAPGPGEGEHMLGAQKLAFLQKGFPIMTVATFAVFIAMSHFSIKWQKNLDDTGDEKWLRRLTNWNSGFFPVFVLFINFSITFWVMSMKPHWYSTIYGIWFLVQQGLVALAIIAIIVGTQAKKEPFNKVVTREFTKDIGNLMLALTLLWAYFSFSQYLIIWSANLPEFIGYYLDRREGGFENLGALLVGFGFFVPFLLLLSPKMKREPKRLAVIGVVILVIRVLDMHYNVAPMFRTNVMPQLGDMGALLAFGGLWCVLFSYFVTKAPLLVKQQPQLKEAIDHA